MSHPHALDAVSPWMNPELTGVGRLRGRAYLDTYRGAADAFADRKPLRVSLNGEWRFKLVERPQDTPSNFPAPALKDGRWDTITVPGCFTMQGYGAPHYTNVRMPFDHLPPQVPDANPTGLYRRRFDLPAGWSRKRVVLRFGSIESVGQVWLNGTPLGLTKDCRLPSEFDITDHLQATDNVLAVQVITWSDASFVEDQDQWWQAGIARDVDLLAMGTTHIEDLCATADYDPATGEGTLDIEARIGGLDRARVSEGWRIACDLTDPDGRPLDAGTWDAEVPYKDGTRPHGARFRSGVVVDQRQWDSVRPWSHELPDLYTLVVSLLDPKGTVMEATRVRVGFRRVEISNRELLLNGKAVLIKGVNRHEHDDRTGKAISRELMERDVRVLKQHNVNAVRTSHYPSDPYFYQLCDEHGLLVVDEANIETHHYYNELCTDPRWCAAFMERGMRMVLRDRNHPSIIAWSLGNESGYGANHDAMAAWIRHVDPSRVIHYEGAICGRWQEGHAGTDLICPMYPSVAAIVDWAQNHDDPRPFIMCEFSHAMGNAAGNLKEYIEACEEYHGLQGGFIWEMLDHGIITKTDDGREYWAYGGDFGDEPNDANFVCDGLVWPDRTPHTSLLEAKALFAPVAVSLLDGRSGILAISNKQDFRSLTHFVLRWELLADGSVIQDGELAAPDIAPGSSGDLHLPIDWSAVPAGRDLHVNLHVLEDDDTPLPGKGHPVRICQVALPTIPAAAPSRPTTAEGSVQVTNGDGEAQITGVDWELAIDRTTGRLNRWRSGEYDLLVHGPRSCVWRAPIDNDGLKIKHMHDEPLSGNPWADKPLRRWMVAGLRDCQHAVDRLSAKRQGSEAIVSWRTRTWGSDAATRIRTDHQLRITADGSLHFEHRFDIHQSLPDLPRIGVDLLVQAGFDQLEWYGLGPVENYRDRRACARYGRWGHSVADEYVPYIMPQEHGHKADVRWLALRNAAGHGLLVVADAHLEANASHFTSDDLTSALHTIDLQPRDTISLHLDAAMRGIGNASCGPDALDQYKVHPGTYRLAYRLVPLAPGADAGEVARQP